MKHHSQWISSNETSFQMKQFKWNNIPNESIQMKHHFKCINSVFHFWSLFAQPLDVHPKSVQMNPTLVYSKNTRGALGTWFGVGLMILASPTSMNLWSHKTQHLIVFLFSMFEPIWQLSHEPWQCSSCHPTWLLQICDPIKCGTWLCFYFSYLN